jgi:ubiquinone/menaquinone biosynthesis C-methylase UbiE
MDAANFAVEAQVEEHHWWFVGRRKLFARELTRACLNSNSRVLDVGTGTGANLRMLRDLHAGNVIGLDSNDLAIDYCRSKALGTVRRGDICALPFADAAFDFVIATDVIEHVDDDSRALREVARVLRAGGRALIAVPAFQSLWGLQDVVAQHKRRYRLRPLLARMRSAGLVPRRYYYFNYLLFAPIWLARRLIDLLRIKRSSEAEFNSPFVNRCLSAIFSIDILTAPVIRPPFGVSILVVGEHEKNLP